jgi:hypothetical protein
LELVERMQEAINNNPGQSIRKLAEEMEVSEWLIRKMSRRTSATGCTALEEASSCLQQPKNAL